MMGATGSFYLSFALILTVMVKAHCQEQSSVGFKDLSTTDNKVSTPFYTGLNGYHSFRIPTVIKTKRTLIAFAEGRKNSTSDFGDIDIVYRRSTDNGKSWEPLRMLYDQDTMAVQNPVPIFVAEEDKVVLLFNTTNLSEHDVLHKDYLPKDERKAYLTSSSDEGKTWNRPRDITRQVKLPEWRWHALGPVHGIVLTNKTYEGRLVVPVAISIEKGTAAYCMALIYSDDSGVNWNIGAVDENLEDAVRANETTIVELSDGRIYVNTRDQTGGSKLKNRGETYSDDGGATFSKPIIESDKFPSPIVQASLLRWATKKGQGKNMLLFATPSNLTKREHLMVMASTDESKSWYPLFKIHHGFSAYSDMVQLNPRTLGIIYETDDYKKIRFRRVAMKN